MIPIADIVPGFQYEVWHNSSVLEIVSVSGNIYRFKWINKRGEVITDGKIHEQEFQNEEVAWTPVIPVVIIEEVPI